MVAWSLRGLRLERVARLGGVVTRCPHTRKCARAAHPQVNRVWYEGKDAKYFRRVDVARWVMTFIIGAALRCLPTVLALPRVLAHRFVHAGAAAHAPGVMTALTAVLITYVSTWLGKVKFTAVAKVIGTYRPLPCGVTRQLPHAWGVWAVGSV